MVAYGLTEYRTYRSTTMPMRRVSTPTRQASAKPTRLSASITEDAIATWRDALTRRPELIARLTRDRSWLYSTMLELGLGFDRGRITIRVRDDQRRLIGMLRYQPWPNPGEPKMLATAGSRRALLPHPAAEPSTRVLLVEGEPDMIAARSHGLRAIATPGADSWRTSWAQLLSDRKVTIIMDCDEQGRMAAATIADDLSRVSDVDVLDLAPDRNDGYDLTDRLLEGWQPEVLWR
jgi:hypothetical protein